MTEAQMSQYERTMSVNEWSVFYQGRQRTFERGLEREVWERLNGKWVKISSNS